MRSSVEPEAKRLPAQKENAKCGSLLHSNPGDWVKESGTGFPACEPDQTQAGKPVSQFPMSDDKTALRAKMREIEGSRSDVCSLSSRLVRQLGRWPLWQAARTVCAFAALRAEPDALDPWPDDKRIALPRVAGDALVFHWVTGRDGLLSGKFGILEPAADAAEAENEFNLILIPGLAFDLHGGRLGRGKGFYDRFLAGARGLRAGVCFDDRIVESVPIDPHDLRMDFVVTPSLIYRCGS